MSLILMVLVNASVFSIAGIGEDLAVFDTPFLETDRIARIEFIINPEFNLLNKDRDFRGIFWTNPLLLTMSAPLGKGFTFTVGNFERFNQSFDVYLEEENLQIHLLGEGGIEEVYAGINKNLGFADLIFKGAYLFGNAWEIWTYNIDEYSLVDTFFYKYNGHIFSGGIRFKLVSLSYEGFGRVVMDKRDSDTTINLPKRLSVGLYPKFSDWNFNILFEHSFWSDDNGDFASPTRFRVGFSRKRISVAYKFNPWYLSDINEHGLDFAFAIPLRNVGSAKIRLCTSLKYKNNLREFKFVPEIKFVLSEIFARRRK